MFKTVEWYVFFKKILEATTNQKIQKVTIRKGGFPEYFANILPVYPNHFPKNCRKIIPVIIEDYIYEQRGGF